VAATMRARSFTREQFAENHPGGMLGRSLTIRVEAVMHPVERVATVSPDTTMSRVVEAMSERNLGCAVVVDAQMVLLGVITDGDLRRGLRGGGDMREMLARSVMTPDPTVIGPDALLIDAVGVMERRESQIAVLPVVDMANGLLGLLRLHDIVRLEVS
jgi:arabinose-5-phosphate isomerase